MALSTFSLNLLKVLILKYIFVPFQRVQIFCIAHFQVYLNLIELNKNLTGSSIFMSGKKSQKQRASLLFIDSIKMMYFFFFFKS